MTADGSSNGPEELSLAALADQMEQAGWDVAVADDELVGRLEFPPQPGVWMLVIDQAGRFRFWATWELERPWETRLSPRERDWHVLLETQRTLTIAGWLDSQLDLGNLLQDLGDAAGLDAWRQHSRA